MPKKLIAFILGSAFTCGANAAEWYGFASVGLVKAAYFFDWETIEKRPGGITMWLKAVNKESLPDSDGSYSTATKFTFDCKKRTMQQLIEVLYDKNRDHIRTSTRVMQAVEVIPGTTGEAALKVVCAPDFPNKKAQLYAKVGDNDIYAAAKRLLVISDDPAPK